MSQSRDEAHRSRTLEGTTMTQQDNHSSQGAVNLGELLTRVENDHELLRELIDIFKKDLPCLLQSLQKSVAREDMKNVEATSHALKGMLSGLSVTQAAATASRLEQMGREGNTSELADALTLLESELADLLPELDVYASEVNP
jgi:HPt (histidine-containing phosphotransfer) domain-containing protein